MNEKEKKAIHDLKILRLGIGLINCIPGIEKDEVDIKAIDCVLNLIDKQQKEIEKRLKEIDSLYKMISIKDERIENLIELVNKYNDMQYIRKIEEKYISKDKMKEKLEEITSYAYTSAEERDCQDYAIQVLKELLGE